jgi:hypothetical protein
MTFLCKKHRKYRATYAPSTKCGACWIKYYMNVVKHTLEVDMKDGSILILDRKN